MIEMTNTFCYTPPYPLAENTYFLSLDTTGFQAEVSAVMMIGTARFSQGQITVHQWLNHTGFEQQALLEAFSWEIQHAHTIITHYGNRFTLPFIEKKCAEYGLVNPLSSCASRDYYEIVYPLRKLCGFSSCRQSALESCAGYQRTIRLSGRKLVKTYQNYVKQPDSSIADSLLLHNLESLDALLHLLPIFSYQDLTEGNFENCSADIDSDGRLSLSFRLPHTILQPLSYQFEDVELTIRNTDGHLILPVDETGQIRHFFPNPKDYYYLPVEDRAIHKSLASYVPREYKRKADIHTCYEKIAANHPSLGQEHAVHRLIADTIGWLVRTAK